MSRSPQETLIVQPRYQVSPYLARWRFLEPYLRTRRLAVLAGLSCVFISTALDQVSPWMIKTILDSLEAGKGLDAIVTPIWAILGAAVVSGALLYFQRLWVIQSSRKIEYEMRRDLFAGLLVQPHSFYDTHSLGDIMSKATNDLDRIRDMVGPVILHLSRMALLFVYTALFLWLLNPRLALIGLLPSLLIPLVAHGFLTKMYSLFGGIQKNLSSLNSFIQDTLSGIHVVKAYGKQAEFQKKLEEHSAGLRDASISVAIYNSSIWPGIGALGAVSIILVTWVGARMVITDEIGVGTLSAIILYLLRLQFPLIGLGWVATMIQRANVSLDRLIKLKSGFQTPILDDQKESEINAIVESNEPPNDIPQPKKPTRFQGINTSNLHFSYGGGPLVLDGIDLTLPAGTSLGIVGPIGAGKTTLLNLICGIYEAPPKTLFLNGKAREAFGDSEWKNFFALAPQDGFLFSTTIRNNIWMGKNARSIQSVEQVGEMAALAGDLDQIPGGYEALLGEKGVNLSGGQRQRVGLARALLASAPILCLDDTLSALDPETETVILENLRNRLIGQTLIIVSHRYSAVHQCNHILFLFEGKILEQGTHAELLARQGAYAGVWEKQKLSIALEKV